MRKLLVVVDMQHDFIDGALGTEEAKKIVPGVKEFIDNFDGEIIYTVDTHKENYLDTQEGKRLPVKHCIKDTEGWKLEESIDRKEEEHFIKYTFGSDQLFYKIAQTVEDPTADLYDEIHFVGLCTGICVIANAILAKTADPEARIVIHKDLCACVTPESHETALKAMELLQMDIV